MTAFNYGRTRATADRLITRFGAAAVLKRQVQSGPVYDPVITDAEYDCLVVVTDYEAKDIDGTRVLATDKKALIAAGGLEITPATDDRLEEADGTVYTLVSVKATKPAGTAVMYEAQIRK